jgi:hypothetical protein
LIRIGLVAAVLLGSLLLLDRGSAPMARCTAPPISREALNAAIAQPVVPFPENRIPDERTSVDAVTGTRLRAFLAELDACANAGEPLRVWSLYAPDYLARLFRIQGPFDEATYAAYATPQPGGTGRGARVASIDAVWKVRDGLYAVQAIKTYPSVPMPKRLIFWIAEVDDQLRIAEITGEISFSVP